MILYVMAVQNVENLQAVRGSDNWHNTLILEKQREFVRDAFNSYSLYGIASRLYHTLYRPVNPGLTYLYRIARRCDIAKQLAIALAAQLQKTPYSNLSGSQLPKEPLDEATYGRFIKNVLPYNIALANFFERYRDGLANYAPNPSHANSIRTPSVRVGIPILTRNYNRETVYRICALYDILKRIIGIKFNIWYPGVRQVYMDRLLAIDGTNYSHCTDVFTFGGLEAVKDIMVQPNLGRRLSILHDHFARVSPDYITRAHALPASTLSKLDRATIERICRLLPSDGDRVLDFYTLAVGGFPRERCSREEELKRFYKHLVTYEGDVPELIL